MIFKKGQKVVCINDTIPSWEVLKDFSAWIVKDNIYTIREIKYISFLKKYGVYLEEIKNEPVYIPELMGKVEPGYDISRFAPLVGNNYHEEEAITEKIY